MTENTNEPEVVWRSYSEILDIASGYLVTEPGNVNAPVAFVRDDELRSSQALAIAWRVADDPESTLFPQPAIDLRHHTQSGKMPGGLHGMICTPIDRDGRPSGTDQPCYPGQASTAVAAADPETGDATAEPGGEDWNAQQQDLEVRWEILRDTIRASVPMGDSDRFRVGQLVEQSRDANGDHNISTDRKSIVAAMKYVMGLPGERGRRLLGGWSPRALSLNRRAAMACINNLPLYPALCVRIKAHYPKSPDAFFHWLPDDDRCLVELMVGVGASKGQVLDAMEQLQFTIDSNWDGLIAGKPEGGES